MDGVQGSPMSKVSSSETCRLGISAGSTELSGSLGRPQAQG